MDSLKGTDERSANRAAQNAASDRQYSKDDLSFIGERANVLTQLRAQIAGQATTVLVALNAGGLAGVLAWLQSLPLQSNIGSCEAVMLRALPVASAFLLGGILATVVAYLLRYRASFATERVTGWMIALGIGAVGVLTAAGHLAYSATYCRDIGYAAEQEAREEEFLERMRLFAPTPEQRTNYMDRLRRESDVSAARLELAISEATLKEISETEATLARIKQLKGEYSQRIDKYGPDNVHHLERELATLEDLERRFESQLRDETHPAD